MRITRFVVLLVVLITGLGFYSLYRNLTSELENQTFQATEEVLVDTAHLLAAQLENEIQDGNTIPIEKLSAIFTQAKQHPFNANIFGLEKSHVGCNFYITDNRGIVLHDSQHPERIGKDFSRYNDVFLALQDRYAVRSSRDVESNSHSSVLYIAVPIKNSQQQSVGVLSLYKPQNDVRPFIDMRHRSILYSLALIGSGITVFTLAVFVWIFRPIGKLTDYARAISRGERPRYPELGKGREVNTLGSALRDMRSSLDGRRYMEHYTQMLTHELKSPLAAIQGAAELLDESMPIEQREKFLSNIRNEAQRSTDIIDGLLKLSRLEAKDALMQTSTFPLRDLLNDTLRVSQSRLSAKNLTTAIDCPAELEITGDRSLLEMALSNLLENAIEFSPLNAEIEISARKTANHLEINIRDAGEGLQPYVEERAFEHFFSMRTHGKGSGLGLVFVKEVAKLHAGDAHLSNHPDGGALASLSLSI